YVWQETILDWHVDGTNHWNDPALPDCVGLRLVIDNENCITQFHMQPDPNQPLAPLRRHGTLVPSDSGGFLLTEDADASLNTFNLTWVIMHVDQATGQLDAPGPSWGTSHTDAVTEQVWSADTDPFIIGEY